MEEKQLNEDDVKLLAAAAAALSWLTEAEARDVQEDAVKLLARRQAYMAAAAAKQATKAKAVAMSFKDPAIQDAAVKLVLLLQRGCNYPAAAANSSRCTAIAATQNEDAKLFARQQVMAAAAQQATVAEAMAIFSQQQLSTTNFPTITHRILPTSKLLHMEQNEAIELLAHHAHVHVRACAAIAYGHSWILSPLDAGALAQEDVTVKLAHARLGKLIEAAEAEAKEFLDAQQAADGLPVWFVNKFLSSSQSIESDVFDPSRLDAREEPAANLAEPASVSSTSTPSKDAEEEDFCGPLERMAEEAELLFQERRAQRRVAQMFGPPSTSTPSGDVEEEAEFLTSSQSIEAKRYKEKEGEPSESTEKGEETTTLVKSLFDEERQGKAELMKLHDVRSRIAPPGSKLCPVWCVHCQKEISAQNKAKVRQHVNGLDHRARWGQARQEQETTKDEVEPLAKKFRVDAQEEQAASLAEPAQARAAEMSMSSTSTPSKVAEEEAEEAELLLRARRQRWFAQMFRPPLTSTLSKEAEEEAEDAELLLRARRQRQFAHMFGPPIPDEQPANSHRAVMCTQLAAAAVNAELTDDADLVRDVWLNAWPYRCKMMMLNASDADADWDAWRIAHEDHLARQAAELAAAADAELARSRGEMRIIMVHELRMAHLAQQATELWWMPELAAAIDAGLVAAELDANAWAGVLPQIVSGVLSPNQM